MTLLASVQSESLPPAPQTVQAALKGVFGILKLWGVGTDEARVLLGSPAESTYFIWRRGGRTRLSPDTLRRIGYIAGIYKALQVVYSDPVQAYGWIHRTNRAFAHTTPLARMLGGDITDLAAVRAYLDAARAPWS